MISFRQIIACWNRFFFEPISPTAIAVFRMALGTLLIAKFLLLLPDIEVWFSDRGTLSMATTKNVAAGTGLKTFPFLPAGDGWVWMYFLVTILSALTFTLGLFTRASSIVLFLMLAGLDHRNPVILHSGDSFLRIVTFFMMFAPAGAACSLDRWRRIRKGSEMGPPSPCEPWAQRLIQLQLAFVYIYTLAWKLMGAAWLDGTAIYYSSRVAEFWRFSVPYVFEHLWAINLMTWGTLVVEFALGFLVWIKELRYWVLLAGVFLHLGIEYTMNIPLFGPTMIAAYITFVEPELLERGYGRAQAVFRSRRLFSG